jgi:hypothetical protein
MRGTRAVAALLFGLSLAAGLAELGARWRYAHPALPPPQLRPAPAGMFVADDAASFHLAPSFAWEDEDFHTNALGRRDWERSPGPPPAGVVRVDAFGASRTAGSSVGDTHAGPRLLDPERRRVRAPAPGAPAPGGGRGHGVPPAPWFVIVLAIGVVAPGSWFLARFGRVPALGHRQAPGGAIALALRAPSAIRNRRPVSSPLLAPARRRTPMKKIVLGLLGLIAAVILAVLGMATTQPDHIHLERSVAIAAASADVAPFAEDLELVNEWSPWDEKDPNLERSYSESTSGVGAWYAWKGNADVGSGKMTVTTSEPGKVVHHLEFIEPFAGVADSTITWSEGGDGVTATWAFDQEADFPTKVMTVFMNMEDMIGPDYDKGLAMLKPLAEKAAQERMAAEKAAAEQAAAAEQPAEGEDVGGEDEGGEE